MAAWLLRGPIQPPALILTTLSGEKVDLSRQPAPVLLNFWSLTCPACLEELPRLEQLYRRYRPRGIQLIAVTMPYDPPDKVIAFVKQRHPPYPVALDPFGRASRHFDVHLVPTWILIGKDGRILWRHTGIPDFDDLEKRLQPHLDRST